MKRRLFFLFAALLFLLPGCGARGEDPNRLQAILTENEDLFLQAVDEMTALHRDRVYAVLETPEKEESETKTGEETAAEATLVWYVKKSDKHKDFDAPAVRRILEEFPFVLLYLQTDADGRRSLIFSTAPEKDALVRGLYYSFDSAPCAWWGRKAELMKKDGRWLQFGDDNSVRYYTVFLQNGFYFFEKNGSLNA